VCSVLELGEMEWNGSIPAVWNGSIPVFGLHKNEELNGFILYSVLELHDRTEQPNHNFFSKSKSNRAKVKKEQLHMVVRQAAASAGPGGRCWPAALVVAAGPPPLLVVATLPGPATAGCGRTAWPLRPWSPRSPAGRRRRPDAPGHRRPALAGQAGHRSRCWSPLG
jgi:hypothetical protein